MTTISPNYAGVNFRATEQVQPKKAAETNVQSKLESKGMSNAMKAGIGLAALSVAVIGGLAAKKHIDVKNVQKNFVKLFEKYYGKVENVGEKMEANKLQEMIDNIAQVDPKVNQGILIRLNEQGLKQQINVFKGMEIPESLLGAKDGIAIMWKDENGKLIKNKTIKNFVCDALDGELNNFFGDKTMVKINDFNNRPVPPELF